MNAPTRFDMPRPQASGDNHKPSRRVIADPALVPLGSPQIIIDERANCTVVYLDRPIRGFHVSEKRFQGFKPLAAHRYAESLLDDLRKRAASAALASKAVRQVVMKNDSAFASIGMPRIIVSYLDLEVRVEVHNKPWGWTDVNRVFLNPDSSEALNYAHRLFARAAAEALAKGSYNGRRRLRNAIGREFNRMADREGRR